MLKLRWQSLRGLGMGIFVLGMLCGGLACKQNNKVKIDDTPKVPHGFGNSTGSDDDDFNPKSPSELSQNADVTIETKARKAPDLTVDQRRSRAEGLMATIKDDLGTSVEPNKKWDAALGSLLAIPKEKPEMAIDTFCLDARKLLDAVLVEAALSASQKGRIGDSYTTLVSKGEGLCYK